MATPHTFLNHDSAGGYPEFGRTNPKRPKSRITETNAVVLNTTPDETEALGTAIEVAARGDRITDKNATAVLRKAANIAGISPDRVIGKIDSAPIGRHHN